jgi:heme oxygenase (mycobilin-producing)
VETYRHCPELCSPQNLRSSTLIFAGQPCFRGAQHVLVVTRFTVPAEEAAAFAARAEAALAVLATSAGYLRGSLGLAADDPTRWLLVSEWAGVGAYRRALSRYEVRVVATPLLAEAHDEPGAFEVVREVAAGGAVTVRPSDRTPEQRAPERGAPERRAPEQRLPERRAPDADRSGPGGVGPVTR